MMYITLNDKTGQQVPAVGLGTWLTQDKEMEDVVALALAAGYRHIDTALIYGNEVSVGNALKKWFESGEGKREDIFVTTKLPHIGNRPEDVERFLKLSLERLQLHYVDLYLMHVPFTFICDESTFSPAKHPSGKFKLDTTDHIATWKVLEEQVNKGLTKNIGVSNFNVRQIKNIYENSTIKPAVLQVEIHGYLQQKELIKVCNELGIAVTAYSPLGSPGAKAHFQSKYNFQLAEFPDVLGHPKVKEIAKKYNKSPGQILLRHLVQQNIAIIPKSSNPKRIKENISIFDFELSQEDIEKLDTLDRGDAGRIFNFLFYEGVEEHAEYPFKEQLGNKQVY